MSQVHRDNVPTSSSAANRILALNTTAFTVCFAVWLMYGALIKFLMARGLYSFAPEEMGALIAAPVLTGSVLRLPVGIWTDRFGGRPVFIGVLLVSALGAFSVSFADGFFGFLLAGLCFGAAGASFAVGIAFTAAWFERDRQGTALGIFGAGNAGAAITLMLGPKLLAFLTSQENPEGWRLFPVIYGVALLIMAGIFARFTENRVVDPSQHKSLAARLAPLKKVQVWRFGAYYVAVFGAFVGLSAWLVNYYVDVYHVSLATAGWLAAAFSMPSGVIRAVGGWLSDRSGARAVMYWVLGSCSVLCIALCLPMGIVPFSILVIVLGISMGIGKAAVYKHIPYYFPKEVGVVGGIVGVLGGLGGFMCPLVFGYLLAVTTSSSRPEGLYTTSWMFLAVICVGCLAWMHLAIKKLEPARTLARTQAHTHVEEFVPTFSTAHALPTQIRMQARTHGEDGEEPASPCVSQADSSRTPSAMPVAS